MGFLAGGSFGQANWVQDPFASQAQVSAQSHDTQESALNRSNQMAIAQLPWQYKQQQFNTVWPFVQNAFGQFANGFGANAGGGAAGAGGPHINANPIWNQSQVQQQVNQGRAFNDQATGAKIRQMQQDQSGRGGSAQSPLAQLLASQYNAQNIGQNAQLGTQTRWNAAQGNAQFQQGAQQAQETQFANRQQEAIGRQKNYVTGLSGILGSLGGFM